MLPKKKDALVVLCVHTVGGAEYPTQDSDRYHLGAAELKVPSSGLAARLMNLVADEFTAEFDTLHSIGIKRPSLRRATTSALVPARCVSPQKYPGAGAAVSMGISRVFTCFMPALRRSSFTACSCASFDVFRLLASTSRVAARAADAMIARSRSSLVGGRLCATQGKR